MIYFYDGTKEGFCCALLAAFEDEEATLVSGRQQLIMSQETVYVRTDAARAKRTEERLAALDNRCLGDLDMLLRSGDRNCETVALRYFKRIAKEGGPVRGMLADADVLAADSCIRRIGVEVDRMHGFLRFLECESGALYAPCAPDADIVDLLLPHFRARLKLYPFVIHDVKRKKAAVYDGSHTFFAPLDRAEVLISADEARWQSLWKEYYASVNIPSRQRLKQMRGYMPVRYWKFMPEKTP